MPSSPFSSPTPTLPTITITNTILRSGIISSRSFIIFLAILVFLLPTGPAHCCHHRHLTLDYYNETCPQVENLVGSVTDQIFEEAPYVGAATIRLFFHDCFIEGCDASIMITSKPGLVAEREAPVHKELLPEAFDSINKAKAIVESECPGVVSCADIIAIAARDFVHLAGGPYYQVKTGRWDGKISNASRVKNHNNVPGSNSTVDELIELFQSKNLSVRDLVVLSGAHTIGYAHCQSVMNRIYSSQGGSGGGGQAEQNIDPRLLKELKMSCPQYDRNTDVVVPLDVTTPFEFDNSYYGNLDRNLGTLLTDQALYLDPRTMPVVEELGKDKDRFFQAFAESMEKMGSIKVKRGWTHGEKREDCTLHM